MSSVEEELENSVEDRANDADIDIIQQGEEENSDQCEMEKTEEREETSSEVRRVDHKKNKKKLK